MNSINYKLITANETLAITVANMKTFMKLDSSITADDTVIENLIKSATKACETECNRTFLNETWSMYLDYMPSQAIQLQGGRVSSITSIITLDDDGVETSQSSGTYYLTGGENPVVALKSGNNWNSAGRLYQGHIITYVAGYGATNATLPQGIIDAITMTVNAWYYDRESIEIPGTAKAALNPYIIYSIEVY
jgi:uncharacterized phiE125 gp8 family phage protein